MANLWSINAPCHDHDALLTIYRWLWFAFLGYFFFFTFFANWLCCCNFFSILKIWVGDFVCKLNVLLWTITLSIGGCLYNFLSNRKSRNKEKKKRWCFCKEKDQENNFWTPLLFPSPSFFSCHSFSL